MLYLQPPPPGETEAEAPTPHGVVRMWRLGGRTRSCSCVVATGHRVELPDDRLNVDPQVGREGDIVSDLEVFGIELNLLEPGRHTSNLGAGMNEPYLLPWGLYTPEVGLPCFQVAEGSF